VDFDFDEEKKANPVDLFIYKPPGPPGRRKVSSGVNGFLSDYLIQLIDCSVPPSSVTQTAAVLL